MIAVFRKWLDHFFADEEALVLLVLIFGALVMIVTMGGVLTPVIASIIFAFLMQGLIVQLSKFHVPRWCAISIAFIVFMTAFSLAAVSEFISRITRYDRPGSKIIISIT